MRRTIEEQQNLKPSQQKLMYKKTGNIIWKEEIKDKLLMYLKFEEQKTKLFHFFKRLC